MNGRARGRHRSKGQLVIGRDPLSAVSWYVCINFVTLNVMRTPWIWSVSLGRWWGVHVRLHLFFFLFAVLVAYAASMVVMTPPGAVTNWFGLICPYVLLLSVLLHEIGHVMVARHLGGIADEIVLGPLGGLAPVRVPFEPHSELVAMMAGTLVNATICCFCAVGLVVVGDSANPGELLAIPVTLFNANQDLTPGNFIRFVFLLNWALILVNLLPVFPFDGGRALQAVLGFLWPELDHKQVSVSITRLGKVVALLILVLAWYHNQHQPPPLEIAQPPLWLALVLLSIYIFFCSRLEELQLADAEQSDDSVFGYDFSQGYTSFERSLELSMAEEVESIPKKPKSPFQFVRSWWEHRKAKQAQMLREQEVEDERRVDEILAQLHKGGMSSLSPEDRALLERVSKRYRSRPTQ